MLVTEPVKTQKIYKVSEITREIRAILESQFRVVWVEGEISNYKRHTSGHIYFTLKDEAAQMNAVFFARENQFLKFDLEDGLHVICIGRISVYDQRGQYQLYVQRMEPKGLGALQLRFLQLKEKLEKEGLFSEERKKPIPLFPRRIGLVTSPTGAAIQDMLKIFRRMRFGLKLYLYPVRVQGDGAQNEISDAIDALNDFGALDVLIVGRGGGSLEDLWAFNEEVLARAIGRSKLPVISAVGHEVDWTIADFVSDFRAHTPTAAAEKIVMNWEELEERIKTVRERMRNGIEVLLSAKREALESLKESYALRQPLVYIQQLSQRVDELMRQLQNYLMRLFQEKRQLFQASAGKLHALSPLAILERGYSVTFDQRGMIAKDAKRIRLGELIRTRLNSGTIKSKVTEVGA